MLRIKQLDHLVLRVTDLPAMMRFYTDVLGCSVEKTREDLGLYQLRAGSSLIDLVPVDGPLEVLARSHPDGRTVGGAMSHDLRAACLTALTVPRHEARTRAQDFSWAHASRLFASFLVPARA